MDVRCRALPCRLVACSTQLLADCTPGALVWRGDDPTFAVAGSTPKAAHSLATEP
jgi:hypothetical protein